jgi:ATP-dependent RNA helicase RhlE
LIFCRFKNQSKTNDNKQHVYPEIKEKVIFMTFKKLNLIPAILNALDSEGYTTPTPIQAEGIPVILNGKDVLGCAQTGTGKTAAFAIPILQKLSEEKNEFQNRKTIKALIITPTRELAIQIHESLACYGRHTLLKHTVIFGGVPQGSQVKELRNGVDIVVATPGRLLDLMNQGIVRLDRIKYFVLDEADRMLDMGFINDIRRIIQKLPTIRQTLLFSATMPEEIAKLADKILTNPVKISVTPVSSAVDTIKQSVYYVGKKDKRKLLIHLLKDNSLESVLIFSRTKHGANKVASDLVKAGIDAAAIHSNKSQIARQNALNNFKKKITRVLVATDIASRGIDVEELSHVINFDLPEVPETYVHRIGRTGRAGLSGIALSFCSEEEEKYFKAIRKLVSQQIDIIEDHPYMMSETANDFVQKPTHVFPRHHHFQRPPDKKSTNKWHRQKQVTA